MIFVENVPKSGLLVVTVYFRGYKDSYQNDSRRNLKSQVPEIDKKNKIGVNLKPLQFCLVRKVTEEGRARSIGVLYTYSYSNMNPKKFRILHEHLSSLLASRSIWSHFDIMVASNVGGV